jgi:hypothetical protein
MKNESSSALGVDLVRTLPDGRIHLKLEDGSEQILGGLSRSELKAAYVLQQNVEQFFRIYPIERIGFLTISFPGEVRTPKDASKRFNSFNTNCLKGLVLDYLRFAEPHRDGRPHYHLLVALEFDIRSGFDWQSQQAALEEYKMNKRSQLHRELTKKYSTSANHRLRSLWKILRQAQVKYGIGRTEILPIRTCKEAAAKYVAGYYDICSAYRVGPWKGVRLTSNSRSFDRAANCRFSWAESGQQWRAYLGEVARLMKIDPSEYDRLSNRLGTNWAYKLLLCCQRDLEPEEALHVVYHDCIIRSM